MQPTRMRRLGRSLIVMTILGGLAVVPARAATPEQVDTALEKATKYLLTQQKNGNWETQASPPSEAEAKKKPNDMTGGQWGGLTALTTYALLAAGVSPQDAQMAQAIKFLKDVHFVGTYALGVKAQLYTFLPATPANRGDAEEDAQKLLHGMFLKGQARGLYDYRLDSRNVNRFDHSVSQYAVLGMWACAQAGVEVSNRYWASVEYAWIRDQDPSGGWAYEKAPTAVHPINAAMTAAGVATLFITQDYLHADNGVLCRGNITNPHIEAGLKWMSDNFNRVLDEHAGPFAPYYALYGVERIGVASGLKYFGTVNWYDVGTDYLMKKQLPNGSWGNVPATCFSVLFLSRGRSPVVFNKLQYDIDGKQGNWNQRPRDIANIVHWISKQIERDLNWQIVSLKAPSRELHDAPMLYLAGNQELKFTPDEETKLREFCENGGILLGNADCGTAAFADSFRKLGTKLFPQYEFRELPPDHPIFTNEQYPRTQWKAPRPVMALSNGVRELMILLPTNDPAKYWQLQEVSGREEAFQLADDIFLYSVDKQNLLEKGKTYLVWPDEKIKTDRTIKLARLQYGGNWNPEPAGWDRLAAILHNESRVQLDVTAVKLGTGQLGDGHGTGPKVAELTGTSKFTLDATSRNELKNFVDGGGTLIVDAAGGSGEFVESANMELATIFGPAVTGQLADPLPATAVVYHLPGGDISEFGYRSFARKMLGSVRGPRLRAIQVNSRPAVFLSREDLSGGLVGEAVDGIIGYDPVTATAIMRNLIIFGGLGDKAAVTPLAHH